MSKSVLYLALKVLNHFGVKPLLPGDSEASSDWLPPVLGPGDWSIGVMADHGAKWFYDRPYLEHDA